MIYVVGSGPAGVSCAVALVKKGLPVRMLDTGLELEPERVKAVERLHNSPPAQWDPASLNSLKESTSPGVKGVSRKYVYGSDFPYREVDNLIPTQSIDCEVSPSLAKGGFSNVWGAGVLPYVENDIADWPISIADLAPHYEAVFSFLDLSAVRDDLEFSYPLYQRSPQALRPSRQAVAFIEDLKQSREALKTEGFAFGYSRLAVRSRESQGGLGCVYCGLCLYGCPHGLIYNSSFTLTKLQKARNFSYVKDVFVEKVVESNGKVSIQARSRLNGERLSFEASRVYLACGVLSTTKILLESLEAYDRSLLAKDSQYFMLPLLRFKKIPDVTAEELHTLCQIFINVLDPQLSEKGIHLSVYSYNDLFSRLFKRILGSAHSLLRIPIDELLGRILFVQGYLHSDISATISVRLLKGDNGSPGSLVLEGNVNESAKHAIRQFIAKLFRMKKYFKAIPIRPLLQVTKPGKGFHIGGTFPMKREISPFASDCLGRPYGFQNVHAVDATIFQSVPAGPITLSVMANAHRIACGFDET